HLTAPASRPYWHPVGGTKQETMSRSQRWSQLALAGVLGFHFKPAAPFTAEQAAAGRAAYEQSCVVCHGADLTLLPNARLAGPEFVSRWENRSLNELIAQVQATMPPEGGAGTLPADTYVALVAYILERN